MSSAVNAATGGDSIWVAAGRYAERITLKPDVALYGGFQGVETALVDRNWQTDPTLVAKQLRQPQQRGELPEPSRRFP